jgi:short-subunit dehydrogenase
MESDAYAASTPKFLYMPSREVARIGVDALAAGRGVVIAGMPVRLVTCLMRLAPRRILLPVLVRQNPGLKRDRG